MDSEPKSASIFVRCGRPTREALEKLAAAEGRTLSNYVRLILERHVASPQKKNKRKRRKRPGKFPFAVVQSPNHPAERLT